MKKMFENAGMRIKFVRQARKIQRKELSECAGVNEKLLEDVEEKGKGFGGDFLYSISRALNVDPNYFITGKIPKTIDVDMEIAIKLKQAGKI